MSQDVNDDPRPDRRVATVAAAALGLLVALAGLGVITDDCEIACGTAAEQAFRESLGYGGLVLGAFSIALAFRGRRAWAVAVAAAGAIACAAAVIYGVAHMDVS